jgi:ribose transport system ATP-binding protein
VSGCAPLLSVRSLSKRFTGTLALDSLDLEVQAGTIHALLGENGAGKSTFIKALAGVYRPDQGSISWRGRPVDPVADSLPVAFIHQDLGLVDTMTVAENVSLVAGYPRNLGFVHWGNVRRRAAEALAALGSRLDPEARVGGLSAAEKSIVAISRALAVQADLLVLDEPTAALPEADVANLLKILRGLAARGMAVIYVTHRLDEVFRVADQVTVLRDGRKVSSVAVADTTPAELVMSIVGRALEKVSARPPAPDAKTILRVDGLRARHAGPVSFTLAAGELLGLVGLRGAGHDIVGRVLFGDIAATAGQVMLDQLPFRPRNPAEAMRQKVGLVSAKRREESLAPALTVRENLFANAAPAGASVIAPVWPKAERRRAARVMAGLAVRPRDPERTMATLSGGNQQKVVLARWFELGVKLLILEEPTFGVDVGSKAEIYAFLQRALDRGLAVLLVSSDFEEVATIAHRALVFDRGRVAAELPRRDITISRLTEIAAGGSDTATGGSQAA